MVTDLDLIGRYLQRQGAFRSQLFERLSRPMRQALQSSRKALGRSQAHASVNGHHESAAHDFGNNLLQEDATTAQCSDKADGRG
ncbi:hypothetical protein AMK14_28120 [Streptomyces sp. TSRI0445]|nr:hypothetical protein AMK14_28120 [Streptomyces sp. TSRI0445]